MTPDPLIGQTLGAYRITRLLKRTGMSVVYLARDDKLERDVVVKVMLSGRSDDESFAARFHLEALATARLGHPNIVHIYDFGQREDLYYMVMEYLPGGSLYDRLVEASARGRRLDMAQALHIASQIADALDHAHRAGFVHRDVKPSNILFSQDGHPVLTDLGIAKAREGPRLTESLAAVGTPEYMSPEQGRGGVVDARSDIYSLGVVLYELLAGALPFRAETSWGLIYKHLYETPPSLQTLNRAVSPALRSVVEKALAKRPEDRFQTAREFAQALERAQASPGRRLYPPPPPPPAPSPDDAAPESAVQRPHRSTQGDRPVDGRTDLVVIPGRVTPLPAPQPASRGAALPWLLGIAVIVVVGIVALIVSGAVDLGGRRRMAQSASGEMAASQTPASLMQASITLTPASPPASTRTAEAPRPLVVRTLAAAATLTPTPGATAQRAAATPRIANSEMLSPVLLAAGGGLQVRLVPYIDPDGRYGLFVPADWARSLDSLGISFESPDHMARILVHQVPDTEPGEEAAAIAQRYVAGARALFEAIREVDSGVVLVGDLPAYQQQLEAEVLNVPVKVRLLAVNAEGEGLVAIAAASAATEATYRVLLAAVLDSFRVAGSLVPPGGQVASQDGRASTGQLSTAPTLAPTRTPAPKAARAPVTATPSPGATATPAKILAAPILISPADGASYSHQAAFSWRWEGPTLAANQGFEVRIWRTGQPDHYGAASPTNGTDLIINLPAAYGVARGGSGSYFWTVAVVQRRPYQRIGPEAAPRRLQIEIDGAAPAPPEKP